ncbi:MAG: hypothetical protein IT238_05190 [Bacteroidia bacterium]|nr:hypothetical protein [Bacteroidia bacterium]MCZ2248310.1 outer membrane beta-barrel protein [Bacteroidia bacterium]
MRKELILSAFLIFLFAQVKAQSNTNNDFSKSGWFSLGVRSTASTFSDEGSGIGTGGQFRIQMSNRVNTDWFMDYISINMEDKVRSEYYHIGWSVIYYPFKTLVYPKLVQPYLLAGHCFDYNKMTSFDNPTIRANRLGSAVQAGVGVHFNITDRFDVTLMSQYMIHLTKTLSPDMDATPMVIKAEKETGLQGHLLTTVGFNYKIFKIWKRNA